MELIIIIALIVIGLLLFLAEVFLLPGMTIAGIASLGCLVAAILYGFAELGVNGGFVVIVVTLGCYAAVFLWLVQSKGLRRIGLKKEITSTVDTPAEEKVAVGDTGNAITHMALIGNDEYEERMIKVRSAEGFLAEGTPLIVARISNETIYVKAIQ